MTLSGLSKKLPLLRGICDCKDASALKGKQRAFTRQLVSRSRIGLHTSSYVAQGETESLLPSVAAPLPEQIQHLERESGASSSRIRTEETEIGEEGISNEEYEVRNRRRKMALSVLYCIHINHLDGLSLMNKLVGYFQ